MKNSSSAVGDLTTGLVEGEIIRIDDGKYRDGVVDNFDYLLNTKYLSIHPCYWKYLKWIRPLFKLVGQMNVGRS
ncbi:hypothetical protein MSWHS_2404 [Methanosarcina sp. WWM596]|nr:hypothetical protein MSWHS_2404 [Methanosarcina sp. WWM596]AKB22903.1 hypothetical protein MSWH1_2632 [Methanosarcina sp. WH1]